MTTGSKTKGDNVPLRQMLRTLRTELQASMQEAEGQSLQFRVDKVELELQVEVAWTGSAKAGVELYVVSIGGKGERSSISSHIFKLTLAPVSVSSGQVLVTGETSDPSLKPE